jgi:hypothetical protein
MSQSNVPITELTKPEQQHMLFLFFPLKAGQGPQAVESVHKVLAPPPAKLPQTPGDFRALTGVHFFMAYHLPANKTPVPPLPVPSFQTAKDKDLLVVLSIYDADFRPYITAFTNVLPIAALLDGIVGSMDESGLYPGWQTDKNSAIQIVKDAKPDGTGGVNKHPDEFIQLLMRYNFADPVIAASSSTKPNVFTPPPPRKYTLGATFPGLTVGQILKHYPQAPALWPFPPPPIKFD